MLDRARAMTFSSTLRLAAPTAAVTLAAVLAASFAGCGAPADAGEDAAESAAGDVVAYIDGEPLHASDYDPGSRKALVELRQQQYDTNRDAILNMVVERAIDRDAAEAGISRDEYLQTVIGDKLTEPTEEEVRAFYEQVKSNPQLQGRTYEETRPVLVNQLRQQTAARVQRDFVESVLAKADYRIAIEPPRMDVSIPDGEPSRGPEDAPVTIVEFSDFQCGYCKRAHPVVEEILAEYGDQVRFVYRDYALANHQRAIPAAEAARCAGDEDRYWDYFRDLMENPGTLSDEDLRERASNLGLDLTTFDDCVQNGRHSKAVRTAIADGEALTVTGTPTFFINGRMLVGAVPKQQLTQIIDEELKRNEAAG